MMADGPGQSEHSSAAATPGNRVQIGDIKAKLSEIDTEVRGVTDIEGPSGHTTTLVVVGVAVALVALAFVLGRRRGRRTETWVEVRRR